MSARLETSGQGEWLRRRFALTNLRTMSSLIAPGQPATYTKLVIGSNGHHLGNIPAENAYSLQIIRNNPITFRLREPRRPWQQKAAAADTIGLFDLETPPEIVFYSPFDTIRCYIPRAALLDLAADERNSVDASLHVPPVGTPDPFIARLGRTLGRLFDEDDDVHHLLIDYLTLSLHSHLLDTYGWSRCRKTRCSPKLFEMLQRRAKEALHAQIPKARSIAEMAHECGLSNVAFTRAFRNATGRLPHQWAMDRRMDLARTRLLRSDDDIATIAAACGFSQSGNFSRAFTRAVGIGPTAWRRARHMPSRGRPVARTSGALSAVHDDSVFACESKRTRECMRFELPTGHNGAWTGDITLQLLPREADAANNAMNESNVLRNQCPRVLLSCGGRQLSEAPNPLIQPKVIVHLDPRVLALLPVAAHFATDILSAPHRADEDELTQELVAGLTEYCRNQATCETRAMGHWVMALCAHLACLHGAQSVPASIDPERSAQGLARWQLREALDAVNARLDSQLSLSCLAARCGLSVGHFATAFARSTGLPPHRWITQQRVARSMQLLRGGSQSFAEIALACGFSDQSHFSRVFSAATGLSPRVWKRSWDAALPAQRNREDSGQRSKIGSKNGAD
jgi:AraC-like DNA-binding protein